ncbi:hypothetical protein PIB30_093340 [Stylosanthes scabra]|uniref:Uncharacterized protein n=1 Tax=Stylosanthes scabra TaxID=79078 RepID=A0ABU6WTE4_9FABA|nr:hypothetical protein [Stylosanthes scabra]
MSKLPTRPLSICSNAIANPHNKKTPRRPPSVIAVQRSGPSAGGLEKDRVRSVLSQISKTTSFCPGRKCCVSQQGASLAKTPSFQHQIDEVNPNKPRKSLSIPRLTRSFWKKVVTKLLSKALTVLGRTS